MPGPKIEISLIVIRKKLQLIFSTNSLLIFYMEVVLFFLYSTENFSFQKSAKKIFQKNLSNF